MENVFLNKVGHPVSEIGYLSKIRKIYLVSRDTFWERYFVSVSQIQKTLFSICVCRDTMKRYIPDIVVTAWVTVHLSSYCYS